MSDGGADSNKEVIFFCGAVDGRGCRGVGWYGAGFLVIFDAFCKMPFLFS